MRHKEHKFNVHGFAVVWGRENIKLFSPDGNFRGLFARWDEVRQIIERESGEAVIFNLVAVLDSPDRWGVRSFLVKCPFCGGTHIHGAGKVGEDIEQYLGNRGSHCHFGDSGDYNIVGYTVQESKVKGGRQ
jgi:hypothetical protein